MWNRKKADRPQAVGQPLEPASDVCESSARVDEVARPTADREASLFGSSLQMKGEISGDEILHIDGRVEGLVQLGDRKLTIGMTANVTADIFAGEVVVYGKLKGNVRATGRIEIKKEGSVDGDLTTPQILIEDGAHFRGSIEIEKTAERELGKNSLPPAA